MNEQQIHDAIHGAHAILARYVKTGTPSTDQTMDQLLHLFDPKGPVMTPTQQLRIAPLVDRAMRQVRQVLARYRDANLASMEETLGALWRILDDRRLMAALKGELPRLVFSRGLADGPMWRSPDRALAAGTSCSGVDRPG